MDHVSRSGVCPKKGARDREVPAGPRLGPTHPTWAVGFEDETGWSRTAHPKMSAWSPDDHPRRLIETSAPTDDPDPKALAAYGLLVRTAQEPDKV